MHGIGERINHGDGFHPARKRFRRINCTAGKIKHRIQHSKDGARGTSGSLTRTMIKNIILINAIAVAITKMSIRAIRSGFSGSGIPAISEPTVIKTTPAIIALAAPARVNPRINSNLRIGVTR